MEDQVPQTQQVQQASEGPSVIKTPNRKRPGKKGRKIFILLLIVILLGGGGVGVWYLLQEPGVEEEIVNDTGLTTPEFQEPTEVPTPTLKPVNKEEVRFQVQNGTGIPKEAGFLKEKIEELGYSEIEVANADEQDYVRTEVTFSKSLPDTIVNEVKEKLEEIYADVRSSTSSTLEEFDVVITTGYKIGFTPAPTKVPSTPTPTTEVTGTVTPTTTPTEAPTPTPQQ